MAKNVQNKIRKYENFTTNLNINDALKKALAIEQEIYEDYSEYKEDFSQFVLTTQKESQRSRVLTYRFISSVQGLDLIQKQLLTFRSLYPKDNFYISPMIYLRICRPNIFLNKKHNSSLLFTEPHYDKSKIFEFFSVWIPLISSCHASGSLCEFDRDSLKMEFPMEGNNVFSLTRYLNSFEEVDPLIEEALVPVYCESSAYLYWNSSTLHGATKPLTKNRISLNYQVFSIKDDTFSSYDVESIAINLFSKFPYLFCFAMLNTVNDVIGMSNLSLKDKFKIEFNECLSLNKDFTNKFVDYIDLKLSSLSKDSRKPTKEKVHWTQDYKWIKEIYDIK